MSYINTLGEKAKSAKLQIGTADTGLKNEALVNIAKHLRQRTSEIIDSNKLDLENAKNNGMSVSLQDRLALDEKRIENIAAACENLAKLQDPVGEILGGSVRPNGMKITKVRVPMGVIGIIYEARPNVTVDAGALCLKSGNAVILRGGKEAFNSNKKLVDIMRDAVSETGFSPDIIQLIEDTS